MNVADLIHDHARTHPDTRALIDRKTRTTRTFGALSQDIATTGAALLRAGIRVGDRVALLVDTGPAFVTLVNALFHAGAVPVLVDPGMGRANMLACIAEQKPRALVGIAKAHVLKLIGRDALKTVEVSIRTTGWFPGTQSLTSWIVKVKPSDLGPAHQPDPDAPAAILYTSGSTGVPKGVVYTHAMLAGQAESIRTLFDIRVGEVDVTCFLPFALFSVAMGMTAVFPAMNFAKPGAADPSEILAALQDERADAAFGSPALWEPFSHFLEDRNVELPHLKRILTAGAPVRVALHERLLAHLPNGDVFTPYGATEALPVALIGGRRVLQETAEKTEMGAGICVGQPAPGVRIKIIAVSDDVIASLSLDLEMPAGQVGEIIVSGPCVTRMYDHKPEHTARAKIADASVPTGFWHRMGDLGVLDDAGDLWFMGRKAHRVVGQGRTWDSVPVEAIVETQPGVARAALAWLGEKPAQTPVVLVELDEGFDATAAFFVELNVLASDHDATRGIGRFVVHEKFPVDRRHNAKIEREKLAAELAADPAMRV